jgi:hypothetical protein
LTLVRPDRLAAACLAACVLAGCGDKPETSPRTEDRPTVAPATGAPGITGFMEVPFGATREQVIARLGPPMEVSWHELGTSLVYPARTLFDETTEPNLVVHPREGLVQGNYVVRVDDFERHCESVYRQFAEAVIARYPGIKPEQKRRQDGAGSFCQAVLEGRASALTKLRDPANGATVRVFLKPGRPFIDVIYDSAAGQRINDAMSDRELKKNF